MLWVRDYLAPQGSGLTSSGTETPPGFSDAIVQGMRAAITNSNLNTWQHFVLLARAREAQGEDDLLGSLQDQDDLTDFDVETLAHLLTREPQKEESFPRLMTDDQVHEWLVRNQLLSTPVAQETTNFMQQLKQKAVAEIQLALKAANIDPEKLETWRQVQQGHYQEDMFDENAQ